ncbi:hypothetical protein PoB_003081100 [Plakobranchus ocellatus]|uniref:Uncharacterized protein n=1 Tax=Plakobranchus ocellatus TaxID=259542 RepID=A0AAV4ACC0_9GAST|nr:hypothetical protein PoB_003081100 [Plakobranchus ocellatus]
MIRILEAGRSHYPPNANVHGMSHQGCMNDGTGDCPPGLHTCAGKRCKADPVSFPVLGEVISPTGIGFCVCSSVSRFVETGPAYCITDMLSGHCEEFRLASGTDDPLTRFLGIRWSFGQGREASPQQGDLRLLSPLSGWGADDGVRTLDRRVPAYLRTESLATAIIFYNVTRRLRSPA